MNLDRLDETFTTHESLAPDADVVLAKSREIARHLRRRQWAVRATGGAVLGVGLAAGGLALSTVGGSEQHVAVITPLAGGAPSTTATAGTPYPGEKPLAAYFNAGYDYSDAQQLAKLWHETDINQVKADAGTKLLDGKTLPIPPSGSPARPEDRSVQAFFTAGYTYEDAVKLGQMWHETNTYQVKAEAGRRLIDGQQLPIAP